MRFDGRIRLVALAASIWAVSTVSHADGLIQVLPRDGSWVRYEVDWEQLDKDGKVTERGAYSMRVSSVGTEMFEDEPCRWIEIKTVRPQPDGPDYVELVKLLVPEKRLSRGENMLEHVRRSWERVSGERFGEGKLWDRPVDSLKNNTTLAIFFGTPLEEPREAPEKLIETKFGKITSRGVLSSADQARGNSESHVKRERRFHQDAPFGVVLERYERTNRSGGVFRSHGIQTLTVVDFGTNAGSEIPEAGSGKYSPEKFAANALSRGDSAAALRIYNDAIRGIGSADPRKRGPEYAVLYDGRGGVHARLQAYEKAIADFEQAITCDPACARAHCHLAWLMSTCTVESFRDGAQAVRHAETACDLTKEKDAECLTALAAALAEDGDFDQAILAQTKAIALAPDVDKARLEKRIAMFKDRKPIREDVKDGARPDP